MDAGELRPCLALASAFKQGDLAVGGTEDDAVRAEARRALEALTINGIHRTTLINDGVTAALDRSRDASFDHGQHTSLRLSRLGPFSMEDYPKLCRW